MLTGTPEERGSKWPGLPAEVESALDRGAMIITANQRSARSLRMSYSLQRRLNAEHAWTPPSILSWGAWAGSLWQELLLDGQEQRLLLSPLQEHAVWASILRTDAELNSLQRIESLAELAQRAWRSLAVSNGLKRLRECAGSVDADAFLRWAVSFEGRCKREHWLSSAQLEGALAGHISSGQLKFATGEFALLGFDRLTPAQTAVRDALRSKGIGCDPLEVSPDASQIPAPRRVIVSAESNEEEACAVAWGIREILEADPQARIAVILPDVAPRRNELERLFRRILAPESNGIERASVPPPFEFSLGRPLASLPMTATALGLLRWCAEPSPYDHISRMLLSPHIGSGDLNNRAAVDERLRRAANMLQPEASLAWMVSALAKEAGASALAQRLSAAVRLANEAGLQRSPEARKTYTEWAAFMRDFLTATGWPGERALDSTEFQLLAKWQSLLDQLATLDFADLDAPATKARNAARQRSPQVGFYSALQSAERLAAQILFAPESHDAPIQIMGTLEAAGSLFDAVFFLGATDVSWPTTPRSAPFLPWQLQSSLRMPNTDAAVEHRSAIQVTRRILDSAPAAFFSYAKRDGKLEFRPSPLLSELSSANQTNLRSTRPATVESVSARSRIRQDASDFQILVRLEEFDGDGNIAPPPDSVLLGGSYLLKLQSLCPFRAFAEQRLASSELSVIESGLDAKQRGTIIHDALERFWKQVGSQQELLRMEPGKMQALLESVASAALPELHQPTTAWDRAYLNLQRRWLIDLLDRWMKVERERPSFIVSNEETDAEVKIGKLRLNLRLDRVDVVGGELLLLDYKTGEAKIKSWSGERPEEPQLPLYATTLDDASKLAGLAFAQVKAGSMCLSGLSIAPGILKKIEFNKDGSQRAAKEVRPDLPDQIAEWRRVLESLADEFHRGIATVTPKNYPETCKHCGQRGFCRISESRIASELVDFGEEEEQASTDGSTGFSAEVANG